jgi:lysophospholipase L1-like esterase
MPAQMKPDRRRLLSWLTLSAIAAGVSGLAACSRAPIKGRPVAPGAKVLALGDSLTYGTGAAADAAYPAVLAALTGWDIVNAGVPGHTAQQAAERLPALLDEHRPALVLVSLGGNDFLRSLPVDTTRAQLREICQRVRASGAQVLLIAVPRPTLASRLTHSLEDHPLYGALSEELRVPLHRRGWSDVLQDETLRADAIHANAAGYRQFAQALMATLRAVGLKT